MYEKYAEKGFTILEFPSNEFGNQAPENDWEIYSFCEAKFGIQFPHFAKVTVNGQYATPLFKYLKQQKGFAGFDMDNPLTPMLLSKLERFEPTADFDRIKDKIERLL